MSGGGACARGGGGVPRGLARGVALSVALSVVARAARGDGPDARAGPHQPHNPSRRPASPVRSVHTNYTHVDTSTTALRDRVHLEPLSPIF